MTPMEAFYEAESTSIIKHLERRGMEGYYCPTSAEAVSLACSFIPPGSTVSWGGSETLIQCGMLDAVKNGDYEVIDRDSASSPQERSQLMHQALSADFFLMSSNAVTKDGQLVNIDGNGNRVAAMIYGPTNVILVIGLNKAVATVEDAVRRARHLAAPTNAQRFLPDTPCAHTGACADCTAQDCICAYISVTRISRPAGKIKVILVGEVLGF